MHLFTRAWGSQREAQQCHPSHATSETASSYHLVEGVSFANLCTRRDEVASTRGVSGPSDGSSYIKCRSSPCLPMDSSSTMDLLRCPVHPLHRAWSLSPTQRPWIIMTSTSTGVVDHEAGGRDPSMSPTLRPRSRKHRIHPGHPSISRPRNRYPGMPDVLKQSGRDPAASAKSR